MTPFDFAQRPQALAEGVSYWEPLSNENCYDTSMGESTTTTNSQPPLTLEDERFASASFRNAVEDEQLAMDSQRDRYEPFFP